MYGNSDSPTKKAGMAALRFLSAMYVKRMLRVHVNFQASLWQIV